MVRKDEMRQRSERRGEWMDGGAVREEGEGAWRAGVSLPRDGSDRAAPAKRRRPEGRRDGPLNDIFFAKQQQACMQLGRHPKHQQQQLLAEGCVPRSGRRPSCAETQSNPDILLYTE